MGALEKRCAVNKIDTQRLNARELKEIEPNIVGIGALLVPATGITDYKSITFKMAQHFLNSGGRISTGTAVRTMSERHGAVQIDLNGDRIESRYVIACGGLMADRLAKMMHIDIEFMIIPFRGEYFQLSSHLNHVVTHLIYPIPDPDLPFLGVHLTRMIDGTVTVGPNAVLGWKREGYRRVNLNFRDIAEMIRFPGFWKTVGQNFKSGLAEMIDSVFTAGYLKRIQKYCPHIALSDLNPYPAGIRAQAVKTDGSLVHDFLFAASERSLHVCNAPSPAATSAIPIGTYLCGKVAEQFKLS
jgi:L-2-hydroxyglutarate oxidase